MHKYCQLIYTNCILHPCKSICTVVIVLVTDHSIEIISFLFSNPDITQSDEETIQIGIIAGSVGGGVVLIVVLLALVICIVVLCKNRIDLSLQVIDLKRHQTDKTTEIVEQLINKNRSSKEIQEVLDALRKQFREIAADGVDGKAKVDGNAEVDGIAEVKEVDGKPQNRKYQILKDFMNTLIRDPKDTETPTAVSEL